MRFIKDWIAKLNSMNVVKNIVLQPMIQVLQLSTWIGVYYKKLDLLQGVYITAILIPIGILFYLGLALLVDKLKIRQHIESEDYKRTYTWTELYKRLDRIEKKLDK